MMSIENAVIKKIEKNGDEVTWSVEVKNLTNEVCYNTDFAIVVPAGISLIGPLVNNTTQIDVSEGTWNPFTNTWRLGDVEGDQTVTTNFIFRVDDMTLVDPINNWFEVKGTLTSSCTELNDCNNITYLILTENDECDEIDLSAGPEV